jgi:hypothetical protein
MMVALDSPLHQSLGHAATGHPTHPTFSYVMGRTIATNMHIIIITAILCEECCGS